MWKGDDESESLGYRTCKILVQSFHQSPHSLKATPLPFPQTAYALRSVSLGSAWQKRRSSKALKTLC